MSLLCINEYVIRFYSNRTKRVKYISTLKEGSIYILNRSCSPYFSYYSTLMNVILYSMAKKKRMWSYIFTLTTRSVGNIFANMLPCILTIASFSNATNFDVDHPILEVEVLKKQMLYIEIIQWYMTIILLEFCRLQNALMIKF